MELPANHTKHRTPWTSTSDPLNPLQKSGGYFEDPETGALFQSTDGRNPERDSNAKLAFRPVSYTPWPVEEDFQGERVRIRVGAIAERQLRTFVFSK